MNFTHLFEYLKATPQRLPTPKNQASCISKKLYIFSLVFIFLSSLNATIPSDEITPYQHWLTKQEALNNAILYGRDPCLTSEDISPDDEDRKLPLDDRTINSSENNHPETCIADYPNQNLPDPWTTYTPPLLYVANNQAQDFYNTVLPSQFTDLDRIIETFSRKLPSDDMTREIMRRAKQEHPGLRQIIKQLRNPELYARVKYPSRLLLIGPSGCGKTTLAEALAVYCDMTCIFIKASSIANTYQNSGAQFFETLFRCLKENNDEEYLVIIDEISTIAQLSPDGRDLQQNKMATAFWLGLDEIRNERHICIVGTDNKDPEMLPDQFKTRFKNNIFYFKPTKIEVIATCIKEYLESVPEDYDTGRSSSQPLRPHACSDICIMNIASNASELSLREIEGLVDKAKVLAIQQANDPNAMVEEKHLHETFAEYSKAWYEKIWNHHSKSLTQLFSIRALTLYTAITGLIIRFYTETYKEHGSFLTGFACLINNYLPRAIGEQNDLPLFSTMTNLLSDSKQINIVLRQKE